MAVTVLWYRRDLRLDDHPALCAAASTAVSEHSQVVPAFVVDPLLTGPSGLPRRQFLRGCLSRLDDELGGRLVVLAGNPVDVIPALARHVGSAEVHVSADFGPYGQDRDRRVAAALRADGRELVATGSPYAVSPGRVRTGAGTGFRVFTPYYRAWLGHGWRRPPTPGRPVSWADLPDLPELLHPGRGLDAALRIERGAEAARQLPEPGERAGRARWTAFRDGALADYPRLRNLPAADGTSRLSPYLRWGCLHPRTLLADLSDLSALGEGSDRLGPGAEAFRRELAWREFYADVLDRRSDSARLALDERAGHVRTDHGDVADQRFAAWAAGRTGYPIVDAGMRQLLAESWLPNRVRMVVASFLVKDLHLPWQRGARHFMHHLVDADLASNAHGWQWVAGTGTDAAPYHRVFNPARQGTTADPDGDYVRRWVPELARLPADLVHEPWRAASGAAGGVPGAHRRPRRRAG